MMLQGNGGVERPCENQGDDAVTQSDHGPGENEQR